MLSFQFTERSLPGRNLRPRPEVSFEPAAGQFTAVFPWGPREAAKQVIARVTDYLNNTRADDNVTVLIQNRTRTSLSMNRLRTAALLGSESIRESYNKSRYTAAVEFFGGILENREWSWAQVGQPATFVMRKGFPTQILVPGHDVTLMLGEPNLAPLPTRFLGLDDPAISYGSLRVQAGDRLVMLASSYLPRELWTLLVGGDEKAASSSEDLLMNMARVLSRASMDTGTWMATIDFVEA